MIQRVRERLEFLRKLCCNKAKQNASGADLQKIAIIVYEILKHLQMSESAITGEGYPDAIGTKGEFVGL